MANNNNNLTVHFTQDDTEYGAVNVSGRPTFIFDFKNGKGSCFGVAVKDKKTAITIRDSFNSMVEWFDKQATEGAPNV